MKYYSADSFFASCQLTFADIRSEFEMEVCEQLNYPGAGYMYSIKNNVSSIRIGYEFREREIYINICWTYHDGSSDGDDSKLDCITLSDLLQARCPIIKLPLRGCFSFTKIELYVNEYLATASRLIMLYARDILNGEFNRNSAYIQNQ